MLINELSKKTGISVHTIRFYEKSGLLAGKRKENITSNNYFHYDEQAVERLALIRDAKAVGFTIREISLLIDAWYNEALTVEKKVAVLDGKLLSIEQKIKDLKAMKKLITLFKQDVRAGRC